MRFILLTAVFVVLSAASVFAQASAEQAYDEAVKKLTQEQREYLAYLDKEFVLTMEPDIRILTMSMKISHCAETQTKSFGTEEEAAKTFTAWSLKVNEEQERLWRDHSLLRSKADFIDKKILDEHVMSQAKAILSFVTRRMQVAEKAGAFSKTDCNDVLRRLRELDVSPERKVPTAEAAPQ